MKGVLFAFGSFVLISLGAGLLVSSLWTHNQHNELVGYSTIIVGLLVGRDDK